MGFPNAVLEQQRVATAALFNIQLDPRTHGDLAVVVLLSIVYFIDLLAIVLLLYNRKYPPLKSKGPILMSCLFVCSVFWFIGDVEVNGHAPLANSVFTSCRGFGIWVRVLLGICGVCAVVALRSYTLYHVFELQLPSRGLRFYAPFAGYVACILVFGIVASALSPSVSAEYLPSLDICRLDEPFKIAAFVFIWVTSIFVGAINWRIRNIKSSFNESREMLIACTIVFAVLTCNTCVQFARPYYPLEFRFRITSTVLDHICCNALLWSIIGRPLCMCIFRRDRYLDEWLRTLRMDGLQRAYEVDVSETVEVLDVQKAGDFGFFYPGAPVYCNGAEEYRDMRERWLSDGSRVSSVPPTITSHSPTHLSMPLAPSSENISWPQSAYFDHDSDRYLI